MTEWQLVMGKSLGEMVVTSKMKLKRCYRFRESSMISVQFSREDHPKERRCNLLKH